MEKLGISETEWLNEIMPEIKPPPPGAVTIREAATAKGWSLKTVEAKFSVLVDKGELQTAKFLVGRHWKSYFWPTPKKKKRR